MKIVLVTGGAGFIGSNFIRYYLHNHQDSVIVNLDKLTYSGNLSNLDEIVNNERYFFVKGDILDKELVLNVLAGKYSNGQKINRIVHFAAESHVDRSIKDSSPFVQTNIVGTQVLLDALRESWDKEDANMRFLHVSTDEVYGSLGETGYFTEQTPINPNSPYSASKASSDLLVRAYYETFKMPLLITRCSNNYGAFQFPEKLIPLVINNIVKQETLPVYGQGLNIRDWLYVTDHCEAIDVVLEKGKIGDVYNIGGNNEWKNIDIVNLLCDLVDEALGREKTSKNLIKFVQDRLGHDLRYAIDASKIKNELGWTPKYIFENGIRETVKWYLDNSNWLENVTSGVYTDYYMKQYGDSV
ncbi:MAG: dTDP-glucose 4,6-dehydratase [Candidatus Margulisbacteria bacterium]|nr:dTDP-glucose 4,6-dehydratase [Candidatus Margulisiibacteriota bacterium]